MNPGIGEAQLVGQVPPLQKQAAVGPAVAHLHEGDAVIVAPSGSCGVCPDCRMLQLGPIAFDASTLELWGPLLHGGALVLYPDRVPTPTISFFPSLSMSPAARFDVGSTSPKPLLVAG